MNTFIILAILITLPAFSLQQNGAPPYCTPFCTLISRCSSSTFHAFCRSSYVISLSRSCGCPVNTGNGGLIRTTPPTTTTRTTTTTTTTTTTRAPLVNNQCGLSGIANPRVFVDSLPRVVGGYDAVEAYFPYQVLVRPGRNRCGGTIVGRDTVITAAHCVNALRNSPGSVSVGHGSIDSNFLQTIVASRIIVHPDYNRYSDPDIAVIKLSQPVTYTRYSRPACLPQENQEIVTGRLAVVTGWGVLQESGSRIPNKLQYVGVPIVDKAVCNRDYSGAIRDGEFCAGYAEGERDACQGDSGGALVMPSPSGRRWELIGVVSRGSGCARPNKPGIYASVPKFVSWIRQYL